VMCKDCRTCYEILKRTPVSAQLSPAFS